MGQKIRTEIYYTLRHLDAVFGAHSYGGHSSKILIRCQGISKIRITVFNRMGMGFLTRQSVLREVEVQNLRNLMSNVQIGFLFF